MREREREKSSFFLFRIALDSILIKIDRDKNRYYPGQTSRWNIWIIPSLASIALHTDDLKKIDPWYSYGIFCGPMIFMSWYKSRPKKIVSLGSEWMMIGSSWFLLCCFTAFLSTYDSRPTALFYYLRRILFILFIRRLFISPPLFFFFFHSRFHFLDRISKDDVFTERSIVRRNRSDRWTLIISYQFTAYRVINSSDLGNDLPPVSRHLYFYFFLFFLYSWSDFIIIVIIPHIEFSAYR